MKNYCLNKFSLLLVLLFFGPLAQSQSFSLENLFSGKVEPVLHIGAHYGKVLDRQVMFNSYGIGFEFESGLALVVAYNGLGSRVLTHRWSVNAQPVSVKMRYGSVILSYPILEEEKWSFTGELGNGIGRVRLNQDGFLKGSFGLYSLEPAVNGRYYTFDWLAITGQLGYRLAIPGGQAKVGDVSSYRVNIGVAVVPLKLYQFIKKTNSA